MQDRILKMINFRRPGEANAVCQVHPDVLNLDFVLPPIQTRYRTSTAQSSTDCSGVPQPYSECAYNRPSTAKMIRFCNENPPGNPDWHKLPTVACADQGPPAAKTLCSPPEAGIVTPSDRFEPRYDMQYRIVAVRPCLLAPHPEHVRYKIQQSSKKQQNALRSTLSWDLPSPLRQAREWLCCQ